MGGTESTGAGTVNQPVQAYAVEDASAPLAINGEAALATPCPRLSAPAKETIGSSDLACAKRKVAETSLASIKTLTQKTTALFKTIADVVTPVENKKAEHYKALAQGLFEAGMSALTVTVLALATTATGGALTPLLALSSLVLTAALLNTVFAAVNIAREKKGLPPVSADMYLQQFLTSLARKLNIAEEHIEKLSQYVFQKLVPTLILLLNVAQLLTIAIVTAVPEAIKLSWKITPILVNAIGKLTEILLAPEPTPALSTDNTEDEISGNENFLSSSGAPEDKKQLENIIRKLIAPENQDNNMEQEMFGNKVLLYVFNMPQSKELLEKTLHALDIAPENQEEKMPRNGVFLYLTRG